MVLTHPGLLFWRLADTRRLRTGLGRLLSLAVHKSLGCSSSSGLHVRVLVVVVVDHGLAEHFNDVLVELAAGAAAELCNGVADRTWLHI